MTSPVLTTARDVADPRHLRAALRLSPADATLAAALRCGTAVALALGLAAAVGRTDLAGFVALGALASLYGRFEPYRRRAGVVALLGGVLTGAVVLTAALTAAGAADLVVLTTVAGVAAAVTALCVLIRTGPPGATIVVFAAAGGMGGQVAWADVAERGLACAAGAAVAWLVVMSGYLLRPTAPARLAVRRADDAARRVGPGTVTDSNAQGTTAEGTTAADVAAARAAIRAAREVLADDASHARTRPAALRLAAELATIERRLPAHDQPSRTGTPGPAGVEHSGWPASPAAGLPARTRLADRARATWPGFGWRLAGVRVLASAVAAGAVAALSGVGHPAWAQMGATATLQGTTAHHAVVRALQRAAGTAVGALLAWPLLAAHLGFVATCVAVVALQVVTEIVVGRHYGLAMLTITPMALLMTSLAAPADPTGMALSRAVDTVVGAAFGVLAVVLVHPRVRSRATPASR
ncbi:FUSC family protein [Isoptericola aurantiacus]|uniref:FUSC family protein n=1 Tax=Isoptericola aurantiacus TaxID=3377839 RepID=UPI003839E6E0